MIHQTLTDVNLYAFVICYMFTLNARRMRCGIIVLRRTALVHFLGFAPWDIAVVHGHLHVSSS
eukprot:jgi/Botrbrau1/15433/Bobra.43_2s0058.1